MKGPAQPQRPSTSTPPSKQATSEAGKGGFALESKASNEGNAASLEAGLRRLEALTAELETLSLEQQEPWRSDDEHAIQLFSSVIQRRQSLIDEMDALREQLDRSGDGLRSAVNSFAPLERDRCSAMLDRIAAGVENVRLRDGRDQAELAKRRAEISQELVSVSRGKGALNAYADPRRTADSSFAPRVSG